MACRSVTLLDLDRLSDMSIYLVPCACGQKTPVDRSRAGMTVPCSCGAQLEIPSLGKLSSLEQLSPKEAAEIAPQVVRRQATAGERWAVLSGTLAMFLAIAAGLVMLSRPVVPPELLRAASMPQDGHEHLHSLNPTLVESLETFTELKQTGLDPQGFFGFIDEIEKQQQGYDLAAQVLGGLAIALIAACGAFVWVGRQSAAAA